MLKRRGSEDCMGKKTGSWKDLGMWKDARVFQVPAFEPTFEVKETHGHWIDVDGCMTICSECGMLGCGDSRCHYCGAEMDEESVDEQPE
jgi:hypothetical protein